MRWTQVLLKHFPAERAQSVTSIDGKNRKNQQEWVCIADSVQQLCPAEILEMNHPARAVHDKSQHEQPDQDDKKLPRRRLHVLASPAGAATAVKLRGTLFLHCSLNFLATRSAA